MKKCFFSLVVAAMIFSSPTMFAFGAEEVYDRENHKVNLELAGTADDIREILKKIEGYTKRTDDNTDLMREIDEFHQKTDPALWNQYFSSKESMKIARANYREVWKKHTDITNLALLNLALNWAPKLIKQKGKLGLNQINGLIKDVKEAFDKHVEEEYKEIQMAGQLLDNSRENQKEYTSYADFHDALMSLDAIPDQQVKRLMAQGIATMVNSQASLENMYSAQFGINLREQNAELQRKQLAKEREAILFDQSNYQDAPENKQELRAGYQQ